MLEKTFLDKLESNSYSKKDLSKVKEAIEYSKQLLSSKKRLAGDSVFDHNLRMANLLIEHLKIKDVSELISLCAP